MCDEKCKCAGGAGGRGGQLQAPRDAMRAQSQDAAAATRGRRARRQAGEAEPQKGVRMGCVGEAESGTLQESEK